MRKTRLLWVGESSFLHTGYGTFANECLRRLHALDEFDITELGAFVPPNDVRIWDVPWRFRAVMPDPADESATRRFESALLNKFGMERFEEVCLEIEPDVVFSYRDYFMDEFLFRSPFRALVNLAHMPAIDSDHPHEQWVASYAEADAIFGYTDWGLDVLEKQSRGRIRRQCATPPGADLQTFFPVGDRDAFRQSIGLPRGARVTGFVSRNQARKLFPDLIEAYGLFYHTLPAGEKERHYLYLHTSYPDLNGWDLPRCVTESGIGSRVLFTYVCGACGESYPSPFADAVAVCRACGGRSALLPDPDRGVSRQVLARVYNCMDVHVHVATCEGLGMTSVEAAACGVPVLGVDFSATGEVVRKTGGWPIAVARHFWEASTGRRLALPDMNHAMQQLRRFYALPAALRAQMQYRARKGVEEHFNYEKTVSRLAAYFRSVPQRRREETWAGPPRAHTPNFDIPDGLSDAEWVRWCFAHVLGRPDLADSYPALRMMRDLAWGATTGGMGGVVFNDASAMGLENVEKARVRFNRQVALQQLADSVSRWNRWEAERVSRCRTPKEDGNASARL